MRRPGESWRWEDGDWEEERERWMVGRCMLGWEKQYKPSGAKGEKKKKGTLVKVEMKKVEEKVKEDNEREKKESEEKYEQGGEEKGKAEDREDNELVRKESTAEEREQLKRDQGTSEAPDHVANDNSDFSEICPSDEQIIVKWSDGMSMMAKLEEKKSRRPSLKRMYESMAWLSIRRKTSGDSGVVVDGKGGDS